PGRCIMIDRRSLLRSSLLGLAGSTFLFRPRSGAAAEPPRTRATPRSGAGPHPGVVTPDGSTLSWTWDHGVKVFHLVAEPVKRQFAPGLTVNCWGYNGQAPDPPIYAAEGERCPIVGNKTF